MVQFSLLFLQSADVNAMSKKRRRDKMEEPTPVWKIVTEHPDIFDTHVMTKLNGNDVKFFYDVNPESRAAIKRSGARLPDAFKIGDFDTTSTISWALEKCSEKKGRFCAEMALKGNLELLQFCAKMDVLGMKVLVILLPKMVTSSV